MLFRKLGRTRCTAPRGLTSSSTGPAGCYTPGRPPRLKSKTRYLSKRSMPWSRRKRNSSSNSRMPAPARGPGPCATWSRRAVTPARSMMSFVSRKRLWRRSVFARYRRASERARALATLALSISDTAYMSWQGVDELSDGEEQADLEADLQTQLGGGLAETVPMMLDEARRLSPIPSDAARLLVTSMISTLECMTPDDDTQRAILDLFDAHLPYLEGVDRDATLGRLAESLAIFGRPEEQRRALNMVLHRIPSTAPTDDWLSHVGAEGRWRIPLGLLNSLRSVDDPRLRSELLNLLANQLAPNRAAAIPSYRLNELLARMVEFDSEPDDTERLLTIALASLETLSGVDLLRPLLAMARREAGPLDDALAERMHEARLRLLPRLPLEAMPADAPPLAALSPAALPTAASLLETLSPEDEACVLAARMNEVGAGGPFTRASVFALVAARLAARAAGASGVYALGHMARALPPDAAAEWANRLQSQLDAQLDDDLALRLAPGPSTRAPIPGPAIAYDTVQAMIDALRGQRR